MNTLKPEPQTLDQAHETYCDDNHLDSFEMLTQREYDEVREARESQRLDYI